MNYAPLTVAAVIIGMPFLSSCTDKSSEKKPLTRDVFVAAVSKCKPLDAKFIDNVSGPPSVEITIPFGSSTVPDCMASELDGYGLKELQINYDRSGT